MPSASASPFGSSRLTVFDAVLVFNAAFTLRSAGGHTMYILPTQTASDSTLIVSHSKYQAVALVAFRGQFS